MSKENIPATQELSQPSVELATLASGVFSTDSSIKHAWRIGKMLSESELTPKQFQGKPADCVLAMDIAERIGASPLAVLQSLYIVHGKPSWSSTFMIAMVNSCGRFEPMQFRKTGEGDSKTCIAWAIVKSSGEVAEGPPVSIQMAKDEGWYGKTGSKWKTMPDLMLCYRAATLFARLYAPELTLGIRPIDELEDIEEANPRNVTPAGKRKIHDPFKNAPPSAESKESVQSNSFENQPDFDF